MQKIATKLTKRVAEFVLEVSGLDYIGEGGTFHYPNFEDHEGFKECSHTDNGSQVGYTSVSEQQFIDMVTADIACKNVVNNPQIKEEMKTKCIVLGQENEPVKELKKIELKECLQLNTGNFLELNSIDNSKFYEFILNPYYVIKGMQLITAKRKTDDQYIVYLGHWNDGVV